MFQDTCNTDRCGIEFNIPDKQGTGITAYNNTGAAIAAGDVLLLTDGYQAGKEKLAGVPATNAVYQWVVVALDAIADAAIGRFQKSGYCEAYVEGTTDVAAGDFLEVLNNNNEFKKDGAARTVYSVARAVDAQATNSNVKVTVWLLGDRVNIAGS